MRRAGWSFGIRLLRYITLFAGTQLTNNEVSISMEVEGSFSPDSTHLEIVDTACIVSEPELTGSTYVFQIQGCLDSPFQAALAPEAAALLVDDTSAFAADRA